jgi:pimeloyl-ACP methyl ester carboxylesterase
MSVITIDSELVHYEVLGRGRPVILVHGWLGSWRYWVPAMQHLSMKYRVYALDLWGFGDSARIPTRYHFPAQVELVARFMSQMGIVKAALVGHDLGAAVAARLAMQHADCVPRLMAVGPPLFDLPDRPAAAPPDPPPSVPSFLLEHPPSSPGDGGAELQAALEQTARAIGEARLAAGPARPTPTPTDPARALVQPPSPAAALPGNGSPAEPARPNPLKDHLTTLDHLELLKQHVDPGPDQDKLRVEAAKADPLAFAASLEAFAAVDTLRDLRALTMPAVLVYGEKDTLLPTPAETMLAALTDGRGTFGVMALGGTRHFPMLEDGAAFSRLLMAFLEAPDVTKIAQKDLWVRRVR